MKYKYSNKKYNVIGYGSLINKKSFKKTLTKRSFKLIIIKGYKRIFDLAIFGSKRENALNIKKSPKHNFNAILFKVTEKELANLKTREVEYNIEEEWAYNFKTNKKLCKSFIFIDPFIAIDKSNKNPYKSYFILCREGAYELGKDFGKYWDETTYTSSGKKISNWLKKNKLYDTKP